MCLLLAQKRGFACSLLEWVGAAEGAGKKEFVSQWAQPLYHYPLYPEDTIHSTRFSSVMYSMMFVCDGYCGASSTREALWFSISLDSLCHGLMAVVSTAP